MPWFGPNIQFMIIWNWSNKFIWACRPVNMKIVYTISNNSCCHARLHLKYATGSASFSAVQVSFWLYARIKLCTLPNRKSNHHHNVQYRISTNTTPWTRSPLPPNTIITQNMKANLFETSMVTTFTYKPISFPMLAVRHISLAPRA